MFTIGGGRWRWILWQTTTCLCLFILITSLSLCLSAVLLPFSIQRRKTIKFVVLAGHHWLDVRVDGQTDMHHHQRILFHLKLVRFLQLFRCQRITAANGVALFADSILLLFVFHIEQTGKICSSLFVHGYGLCNRVFIFRTAWLVGSFCSCSNTFVCAEIGTGPCRIISPWALWIKDDVQRAPLKNIFGTFCVLFFCVWLFLMSSSATLMNFTQWAAMEADELWPAVPASSLVNNFVNTRYS